MDKDDSFNAHCGPMFAEVTASLYAAGISGPKGINYIYGLGGRDVRVESIQHVFAELEKIAATGEVGLSLIHICGPSGRRDPPIPPHLPSHGPR